MRSNGLSTYTPNEPHPVAGAILGVIAGGFLCSRATLPGVPFDTWIGICLAGAVVGGVAGYMIGERMT